MVLLLLLLLLVMVMTMISVLGCTVAAAAAAIASGYRCVTLERNSVGNHGVAIVATAQINRVGMIVATGGQSTTATANDDIVVVLKASIVVVVVDYDASVASGTAVSVLISAASGHDVMLLVRLMGQRLLQDKLVRRFHGDR